MARRKPKGLAVPIPPPPPAPLTPRATIRFEKDVERLRRRGLDMEKFKAVVVALCSREPLPASLRDHGLRGEWEGCRDCHVAPDWTVLKIS